MPLKNIEKRKKYNIQHKIKYHDYYISYNKKRFDDIKEDMKELKTNGCSICGYDKCFDSLHFHHVEPKNKIFKINTRSIRYNRLIDELNKCVLLCANCHGEVHRAMKKIKGDE